MHDSNKTWEQILEDDMRRLRECNMRLTEANARLAQANARLLEVNARMVDALDRIREANAKLETAIVALVQMNRVLVVLCGYFHLPPPSRKRETPAKLIHMDEWRRERLPAPISPTSGPGPAKE